MVYAESNKENISWVCFSAVCLLLAAKLNQPRFPSFLQMLELIKGEKNMEEQSLQSLIDLEFKIVSSLQFDLQIQTPLTFLGRFLMFYTDHNTSRKTKKTVE
jgi:hypothetical protein